MSIPRTIEELASPHAWETCRLKQSRLVKGPYKEMARLELSYECKGVEKELGMKITFFGGRPPHYPAWVEIHGWDPLLYEKGVLEEALQKLQKLLPRGARVFLEYSSHAPTRRMLEKGVPPQETPLGQLLLARGFASPRDLYYPEGYREGGPKLLAFRT